uniref:Aquaporin 10a n=1 Tax=Takifugu rubripes TaxID=31033 RepID=A0A674M928_TAKRU
MRDCCYGLLDLKKVQKTVGKGHYFSCLDFKFRYVCITGSNDSIVRARGCRTAAVFIHDMSPPRLCPASPEKLFGCSAAAQVKTSRETKGQYLSVNMAFSVGAHLNPAVTLSFCALGQVSWDRLVPYCLSQLLGAYIASGLVYLVYYDAIMNFSGGVLTVYGPNETASIFATYPSEFLSLGSSFLDQVIGTSMLMLCILGLGEQRNTPAPSDLIPAIVAVIVLGISMSMSGNCGAAINPARDLGPRLFTLTAGWGPEVFTCYNYWFWVPLVAPCIGALIGTLLYQILISLHLPDPAEPERKGQVDPPRKDAGMSHSFGIRATVGGNCGHFIMGTERFHLTFPTGTFYFIEDSS